MLGEFIKHMSKMGLEESGVRFFRRSPTGRRRFNFRMDDTRTETAGSIRAAHVGDGIGLCVSKAVLRLTEFTADAWDRRIEEDATAGRLDSLADEALEDLRAGRCTER
jgi:hypothetical protein